MILRSVLLLLGVLLCWSCTDNSNKNQALDNYVQKEIADRITRIQALNQSKDTVFIDPGLVDKKVNDLLLLSKDIENLGACVNKANVYFDSLITRYHLNRSDLKKITVAMHIDDIASTLKQNEMVVFNHVLLKDNKDAIPLHAAQ